MTAKFYHLGYVTDFREGGPFYPPVREQLKNVHPGQVKRCVSSLF